MQETNNNDTPLHDATSAECSKAIEALGSAGADLNAKGEFGFNPLHSAAYWGHTKALEALVAAGADINARDGKGRTPPLSAPRWGPCGSP